MLSKEASSTIFWVFGMTRSGIEPRSPGLLANTLTARPCQNLCYKYYFFTFFYQIVLKILFENFAETESCDFLIIRTVRRRVSLTGLWNNEGQFCSPIHCQPSVEPHLLSKKYLYRYFLWGRWGWYVVIFLC